MWARVENEIVGDVYENLPPVWENITNPAGLSLAELKSLGWYPVEVAVWDEINTVRSNEANYALSGDKVILTYITRPLTVEEIKNNLTNAVQQHLDAKAQEMIYDNIFNLCTYDGDPNPVFADEGHRGKVWRSNVWRYCLQVMVDVQAGIRTIPTPEELIAELPVFE